MGLEDLKKSFDGAITAAANAASDATSIAKKSIQSIDISDAKKVQEIANMYDIMGIVGNGASYSVQMDAGIEETDLIIPLQNLMN